MTDFATSLRVTAFRLMSHEDPMKKERFLITAFLKGLRDKKLIAAIETMISESLAESIDIA